MHRCIFGKDILRLFRMGPSSLYIAVAKPDKRRANGAPQKSVLRLYTTLQILSSWFQRLNE